MEHAMVIVSPLRRSVYTKQHITKLKKTIFGGVDGGGNVADNLLVVNMNCLPYKLLQNVVNDLYIW